MNAGNLFRSAHAFGASFLFTIAADERSGAAKSDTSRSKDHLPLYNFGSVAEMALPEGCKLVGVELLDEAAPLPVFCHPLQAAYVLGPEKDSLSPALIKRCDALVRIPTAFCINLGVAGAIVMYDRMLNLGRFGERPLHQGGQAEAPPPHAHGGIFTRKRP